MIVQYLYFFNAMQVTICFSPHGVHVVGGRVTEQGYVLDEDGIGTLP